jgi:hypothetical protein
MASSSETLIGLGGLSYTKSCSCDVPPDWLKNYLGYIAGPPRCPNCGVFWKLTPPKIEKK